MKRLRRKIFSSEAFRHVLSYAIAAYMRLVMLTCKKHYFYPPETAPYFSGEKQVVSAFWHGRMLVMPFLRPPGRTMDVLISSHRDGLIISKTMQRFSIGTIAGSTSKGSLGALKHLFSVMKKGGNFSITPDGPRGPFQVAASGVAHIVARTKIPLVPVTFSATRYKRMKSWDRFMVALPFSTLYFVAGPPIAVDADDVEALRLRIERALCDITDQADRLAGIPAA